MISYANFPVHDTIELQEISDIRRAVDKLVEAYVSQSINGEFSYRILLPRGEKLITKAKRIGLAFQGELILGLRRRNIVPNIREIRYVHDNDHYGWILANSQVYDQFKAF
jgi:hypothetical protein